MECVTHAVSQFSANYDEKGVSELDRVTYLISLIENNIYNFKTIRILGNSKNYQKLIIICKIGFTLFQKQF